MKLFSKWITIFKQDKLLHKILRNSGYLLSSNVASMGLSIIQSIFAGRLLGVAGFGLIGTITVFATTLNKIFSFRMNELIVKYFGESLAENNLARGAAVVKAALIGETFSAIISFVLLIILAPYAASRLADDPTTAPFFIIYGLIILANFCYETSIGIIQVTNKFQRQAIVNLISSMVNAGIIAWAYLAGKGVFEILAAYIIGKFILGIGTSFIAWREMNHIIGRRWLSVSFAELPPLKELLRFAFSTNLSNTIIMLVRDNEALWIAWFLTTVDVGYAKTALAIINLVQVPITPFIATTYPEINAAVVKKKWQLLRRILKRVTFISASWTLLTAFGLILFGKWLLLFYGPEFTPAYIPMLLFLVGLGFANIFFWNRPLLLSLGLPLVPYKVSLWCGIAKIGLAFLLVPRYGLNAEALLLSGFFVISISIILAKGFKQIRIQEIRKENLSTA